VSLNDLRSFRRLIPAYTLADRVYCWECSLCHKLFLQIPHDVPPSDGQISAIYSEFEHHDCTVQLTVGRDRTRRA